MSAQKATIMQGKIITTDRAGLHSLRLALTGGQRRLSDVTFQGVTALFVLLTVASVFGIAWVLISYSLPSLATFGFHFLTNQAFDPVHNIYGVAPAIFGTLVTSFFAIIFAVPIGLGAAIFLVEFCPRMLRPTLSFIMDMLAAVPSVVYGLWGFLVMAPWLINTGEPWLHKYLGFLPFFNGQMHGLGLLAAGMILVIMILPLIISVSREVMLTVPRSQREALLALGATRWEVIRHAILPGARVGIVGGIILALGRALGETMAVTMVIGNQAATPSWSLFNTGYTLSSVIANQFGEATPGLFLSAVIEAGLLVFVITLIANTLARLLVMRVGKGHVGGLTA
jgi:phosphate transport system permease protein